MFLLVRSRTISACNRVAAIYLTWGLLGLGMLQGASVLTQHNDLGRTGATLAETVLTTNNVNSAGFGKLFTRTVDGQVYAQILYSPLTLAGKGLINVIYVATEHNSVYAFEANSPYLSQPLWKTNLGTPILCSQIAQCDRDLVPEIGITSTPVVDPISTTLYVVAETFESGAAVFRLHALNLVTGAEKTGSLVVIAASVPGDGAGSVNGTIAFNPMMHWQRAGLLLYQGWIYIGFGSHQDTFPFHGWLMAYNAATLTLKSALCFSPHSDSGALWQGGAAPAVDSSGGIQVITGNGNNNGLAGGDLGSAMVKLDPATLKPLDFFSPSNAAALDAGDDDFGSAGPLVIPGTKYVVGGGKDGKLFLVDTTNMGRYDGLQNHVSQYWQATYSLTDTGAGGFFGANAWYNNTLYVWGRRDGLKAFSWTGTQFQITPSSTSAQPVCDGYSSEPALSISANGVVPGSGIVWATSPNYGPSDGHSFPGTLHAFDAANLGRELWNSNQNAGRDTLGSWAKWVPPTVANGKVYVPTFDGAINVYGLLSANPPVLP